MRTQMVVHKYEIAGIGDEIVIDELFGIVPKTLPGCAWLPVFVRLFHYRSVLLHQTG